MMSESEVVVWTLMKDDHQMVASMRTDKGGGAELRLQLDGRPIMSQWCRTQVDLWALAQEDREHLEMKGWRTETNAT
jgi:hypothetical protein